MPAHCLHGLADSLQHVVAQAPSLAGALLIAQHWKHATSRLAHAEADDITGDAAGRRHVASEPVRQPHFISGDGERNPAMPALQCVHASCRPSAVLLSDRRDLIEHQRHHRRSLCNTLSSTPPCWICVVRSCHCMNTARVTFPPTSQISESYSTGLGDLLQPVGRRATKMWQVQTSRGAKMRQVQTVRVLMRTCQTPPILPSEIHYTQTSRFASWSLGSPRNTPAK